MYLCTECKKEMLCAKNEVYIHYGNGHCYMADDFECKGCGSRISVVGNNQGQIHLPEDTIEKMKEHGHVFYEANERRCDGQ